ncbi:MAG: hypothetical protein JW797_15600 [Bradymonadales bacterium]|nr:hypothetical protein [Bradymonadales bacterium]
MTSREFFDKMQTIDRRWIFLLISLAVIIPLLFEFSFTELATPEVSAIYNRIEGLQQEVGRRPRTLISFDFDPPSEPELMPMAISLIRHLVIRNHQIYMMALWPIGQQEADDVVRQYLEPEFPQYTYGEDYMTFGFQPGGAGLINVIVNDFRKFFSVDSRNNPIDSLPMMADVVNLFDMDLILDLSAGAPGIKEWVQFGGDRTGVPVAGCVTAVQAPLMYPYYPRQMFGMLGGMKAAAEYESLVLEAYGAESDDPRISADARFLGIRRMGPQTFAHLVIILFIIIGNIAFFATRGQRGASRLTVDS